MEKTILTLVFVLTFGLMAHGQRVVEGRYEFMKKVADQANGISLILNGSTDAIQAILQKKMKAESGVRVRNIKHGIQGAEAVRLSTISQSMFDYYYKLESVGKKNENQTRLTLFVSAGNYNFLTSEKYPVEMEAAKNWLSQVARDATLYQQQLYIEQQARNVAKAEKELENTLSEREKLEEMLADIQAKIEANSQSQLGLQERIQGERNRLEKMQAYMYELKR